LTQPAAARSATIGELLIEGVACLERRSESPRADATLLLAHAIGSPRERVVAHAEAEISHAQARRFAALCDRRAAGVPIAYLLGSAEFYGRDFDVNEKVLVPRPETEHLVDEALRAGNVRAESVLDVGTGCGVIACTIAAETDAIVAGTVSSFPEIGIARENARRLGVAHRCAFHVGDLTQPVRSARFDVVVANLPYIPTRDLPKPPDPVSFEPREALDGGIDGLALYRRLLEQLPPLLNDDALILLEAAPPTINELKAQVACAFPNYVVEVGHDYAGLARYVKAVAGPRWARARPAR
jgi:release factor glutamine methyltransferase